MLDLQKQEMTLETLVIAYLSPLKENTRKNYQRGIRHWAGFLIPEGSLHALNYRIFCQVETSHVRVFCARLLKDGLAGGTIGVYLAGLTGLYDLIVERGDMRSNPFRSPLVALPRGSKAPLKPHQDLGREKAAKLLEAAQADSPRSYAMMCLLLGGGLRLGELLALRGEDVNDHWGITLVRLYHTKSGERQDQSLPAWAANGVTAYLNGVGKPPYYPLFDYSRSGAHKWFKRMQRKAGVWGGYTIHSCRTTAINELIRQGVPLREVRQFSRHKSVATVERYERALLNPETNPGLELSYAPQGEQ